MMDWLLVTITRCLQIDPARGGMYAPWYQLHTCWPHELCYYLGTTAGQVFPAQPKWLGYYPVHPPYHNSIEYGRAVTISRDTLAYVDRHFA